MINTGLTIGSDAEFAMLSKTDLVRPNFDAECRHKFGRDGAGYLCELRPTPGRNENDCLVNIKLALNKAPKIARKYMWRAGAYVKYQPVGGHMHFGNKKIIQTYENINNFSVKFVRRIAEYVGVPALLISNKEETEKRRNFGYGGFTDSRNNAWGIEYRGLSSWLFNEDVTKAVHSLAFLVSKNILLMNNNLPVHRNIRSNFNATNINNLKDFFPIVWNCITKLKNYEKYYESIKLFPYIILNDIHLDTNVDMRKTWKIE